MLDWLATRDRLIAGGLTALFAGPVASLPATVWFLLGAQAIDVVSGVLASGRAGRLDSREGWLGLRKKALTWCVVAAAFLAEVALERPAPIGQLTAGFFLGMELLSILENAGAAGVPVPEFLRQAIARLRSPEPPRPGPVG